MKKIHATLLVCFTTFIVSAQNLDTLLYNGDVENRINIVILGDGYRQDELVDFEVDAKNTLNEIFAQVPFKQYKSHFNVFIIPTVSAVSGAALDPEHLIDNYYGSTYNFAGIERLLVPMRNERIAEELATNFPSYDQVLMIVNDTKYGGSGGPIATASVNELSFEIMIHEMGHSFGDLADEYWAGIQYAHEAPNMTKETSVTKVKWANWISEFGIGIYPFTENSAWKKPHRNCKMQFLGVGFCSVCKETLINKIQSLTQSIDDFSPVEVVTEDHNTFTLQLLEPSPNTLQLKWYLNSERISAEETSFTIARINLPSPPDTLVCEVTDTTLLNRRDMTYVSRVQWVLDDQIKGVGTRILRERNINETPVTDVDEENLIDAKLFPIPYKDKVSLDYHIRRPGTVLIKIIDLNGKLVSKYQLQQSVGEHHQEPDLKNIPFGVLQLKADGKWITFKVFRD